MRAAWTCPATAQLQDVFAFMLAPRGQYGSDLHRKDLCGPSCDHDGSA